MTDEPAIDPYPPTGPEPGVGRRRAWVAALLTVVAAGVGHVYAGRPMRGLVAAVLALAFGMAMLQASMMADARWARLLALGLLALTIVVVVADAAGTAREADPAARRRWYQRWWMYAVLIVAVAFVIDMLVLPFAQSNWRAFRLRSHNMAPTLLAGDYVMTARGNEGLQRGMVITRVTDEGFESIGRIVGVAGDTLSMSDGTLRVNGSEEPAFGRVTAVDDGSQAEGMFHWQRRFLVGDTAGYAPTAAEWGPLVVPPGNVFVLGDNRPASLDSRHLGFIPLDHVTGRVDWIYFSRDPLTGATRWGRIGQGVY